MLPPGPSTLIQHIVLIVLENRSFDHLAGWTETPNGQIQNYTIGTGGNCDTFALNGTTQPPDPCPANYPNPLPDYIGTGSGGDPGHGISEMATFWNGGDNKGWLLNNWITGAPENTSHYAIGYYQEDSTNLPFLWSLLKNTNPNFRSVLVHRYFSSMIAQTNPNRMYEHSGTTDRYDNVGCRPDPDGTVTCTPADCDPRVEDSCSSQLNGIWTVIRDNPDGSPGGSYYSEAYNYLNKFWPNNPVYQRFQRGSVADFKTDLQNNFLNPVTVIDGFHYHPSAGDISKTPNVGADEWLEMLVTTIVGSRFWGSTAIVITFDEGGGFFDHVSPKKVPTVAPYIDNLAGQRDAEHGGVPPDGNNEVPLGFRVPAIIISPYRASPDAMDERFTYEHSSALRMIEWAFNYSAIASEPGSRQPYHRDDPRYDAINNLACTLDFTTANMRR
jgi:phospholipase C